MEDKRLKEERKALFKSSEISNNSSSSHANNSFNAKNKISVELILIIQWQLREGGGD